MAKPSPSGVWIDFKQLLPWSRRLVNLLTKEDRYFYGKELIRANVLLISGYALIRSRGRKVQINDRCTEYLVSLDDADLMTAYLELYKAYFEFITDELLNVEKSKEWANEKEKVFRNIFMLLGKAERSLARWQGEVKRKSKSSTLIGLDLSI